MAKIIKLKESDVHRIVKKVINEQSISKDNPYNPPGGGITSSTNGGTSTASAGQYISPASLQFRDGGYDYDEDNPYDPDYPDKQKDPKDGAYETKLGRSPMCCKKCKNGKFKHQCDDNQKGGQLKYDSTNCVYDTISDCQLNKRSKPGNIAKKSKK